MVDVLFSPAKLEGRVLAIGALRDRLREIAGGGVDGFTALKKTKDIDRALPRLIVAVSMMEAFGYTELELTERELGAGLIIEAGLKTVGDLSAGSRCIKTLIEGRSVRSATFLTPAGASARRAPLSGPAASRSPS